MIFKNYLIEHKNNINNLNENYKNYLMKKKSDNDKLIIIILI